MGTAIGVIVGSALLLITLGLLWWKKRKNNNAMARLTGTNPTDVWPPAATLSMANSSLAPLTRTVTLETISPIRRRGSPDDAGDIQPQNEMLEIQRPNLLEHSEKNIHWPRETRSSLSSPTLDETTHAVTSPDSGNDSSAPISLAGPVVDSYVTALQERIGMLRTQLDDAAPPPAYEEGSGEAEAVCA